MARLTKSEALDALRFAEVSRFANGTYPNFYALRSYQVGLLLERADAVKYRAPKNANGSRGRYFYAYVLRTLKASD